MTIRILFTAAVAALAAACSPAPTVQGPREGSAAEYATVAAPLANARVASPLTVSGAAPEAWFFEDQFDVVLLGDDGVVYAQAPARAAADWDGQGPKQFAAEFDFTVSAETPATILLQERVIDEEQAEPLQVRVPVTLAPTS